MNEPLGRFADNIQKPLGLLDPLGKSMNFYIYSIYLNNISLIITVVYSSVQFAVCSFSGFYSYGSNDGLNQQILLEWVTTNYFLGSMGSKRTTIGILGSLLSTY